MSRLSALLEALRSFGFRDNPDYALRPSLENPRVHRWTRLVPEERHGVLGPEAPLLVPAGLSPSQGRWLGEALKRDAGFAQGLPHNEEFRRQIARTAALLGMDRLAEAVQGREVDREISLAAEATARELIPHLRVGIWHHELYDDDYIPGTALTRERELKGYRPTYDYDDKAPGARVSAYVKRRLEMDRVLGWQHPSDNLKRPVYGIPVLVSPPGAEGFVLTNKDRGRAYGHQLSVLKPEVVARTTFTQGDSMNAYTRSGRSEEEGEEARAARVRASLGHARMAALSAATPFYFITQGAMNPPGCDHSPEYTEAQVFGGVRMSRDREALLEHRDSVRGASDAYVFKRILDKLR